MPEKVKILLIGYGNPAREDDGLGIAVAEEIEKLGIDGITVDSNYQLTVEDAAEIAKHDAVIFVDASLNGEEPFTFTEIEPSKDPKMDSHSMEPDSLMGLTKELFNSETTGYILGIRGYSFEMFNETITKKALENLENALNFLTPVLRSGTICSAKIND